MPKKMTKLSPLMWQVLEALAQDGAYISNYSISVEANYGLFGPSKDRNISLNNATFYALRDRGLVKPVRDTWRPHYVISDKGLRLLAERDPLKDVARSKEIEGEPVTLYAVIVHRESTYPPRDSYIEIRTAEVIETETHYHSVDGEPVALLRGKKSARKDNVGLLQDFSHERIAIHDNLADALGALLAYLTERVDAHRRALSRYEQLVRAARALESEDM